MEPVTHFLTGACLGRSGFNRKTAYATLAMTLAAEAPDIDMLWGLRGPVAQFEHHRGITHTFLGAPFMALLVTGVVWAWDGWRSRRGKTADATASQPVRWGWIWTLALIADLSHILLDWTNNYGVRPLFPFNPHWYYGSLFFLFEPVFFAALVTALLIPAVFGLADREIGARRARFRGRGWAIFALMVGVLLGCWRWAEKQRALHLLAQVDLQGATVIKSTVNPYPGNPFDWFGVVETRGFYRTAFLDTRTGQIISHSSSDIFYKQPLTPAMRAAEASWLGRVYMDWSQYPLVFSLGTDGSLQNWATAIRFEDLRFAYNPLFLRPATHVPLSGNVQVAPDGSIDEMRLNGHVQR